jgi:pyruvate-ferredoxin/flavodoxin oxidoreductase
MFLAHNTIRKGLIKKAEDLMIKASGSLKVALDEYLSTQNNSKSNLDATDKLIAELEKVKEPLAKELLENKDYLAKKSQWILGGDGWAYDIGFGGLDHVLASNEDVNILVFDTEVYSNTGGQSSKSTPTGSVAQFAAGGKEVKKKDLASIAMSYGYVYVAQIAMGYDMNQTVKAITEAENYNGPSIIIAYAPCINHGIKKGMGKSMIEAKLAVECGYWHTFRFNPELEGSEKFSLDSKFPNYDKYRDFLDGEVRYASLALKDKEKATALDDKNMKEAIARYNYLNALGNLYANTTGTVK